MRKKHYNVFLALLLIVALLTTLTSNLSISKTAKAESSEEPEQIIYSGYVNGIERTLLLQSDYFGYNVYLKIGDENFRGIRISSTDCGFDRYSVVWSLSNKVLGFWSYDLTPDFNSIVFALCDSNVESLIFEGSGSQAIVVGYTTVSGETYDLPDFETIRSIRGADESIPEPFYGPFPDSTPGPTKTPTLSSPTPVPAATETPLLPTLTPIPVATTETPVPTVKPTVTPEPTAAATLSIEKSKSKSVMYQGNTMISKLTLKKGTLTWERQGKKTKRYKGVKDAALIMKSKNAVFITKKGAAYTVSYKTGKKKLIVKKGAKKIRCVKGSAAKIKMASGKPKNIKNK